MPKIFKRLAAKAKDKIARVNYERDHKYLDENMASIASPFDYHVLSGRLHDMNEENKDDASSVSSFSTTATVDDNPGAGLTVDKYFYQPVGRKIEKIAFRIAMPFLSPGRIFQYIEENHFRGELVFTHGERSPISNRDIWPWERNHQSRISKKLKPEYLAGLSSLVSQAG